MATVKSEHYYESERGDVFAIVPADAGRILEIGCGAGAFRRNFPADAEYWGVEPVREAAAKAVNFTQLLVGTLEEVAGQIPDGYFDLVVCNDVIEHIADTAETLATIRRKLRKGGRLVASLPNVRYLQNLLELLALRDWRYRECGILDDTHLRFFTFKSGRRALEDNGFEIEEIRGSQPSMKMRLKFCVWLASLLFGGDVKYLQMLIRARVK